MRLAPALEASRTRVRAWERLADFSTPGRRVSWVGEGRGGKGKGEWALGRPCCELDEGKLERLLEEA